MRVPVQSFTGGCSAKVEEVESEELVTPPPNNGTTQPSEDNNCIAIYNGDHADNSEINEDYNCSTENFLSNTSLIEIIPADILQAQEIYTTENVITDELVTEISENKQNIKEFTNVIINEKREAQPINQAEGKSVSRSPGAIGRGRGRQKTNSRINPSPSLNTSIGRGRIRQMVNQPVSSQFRTIASERRIKIFSASKQCPTTVSTPNTSLQTSQEDWRSRHARQSTVTSCIQNAGRARMQEMPMVNQEFMHWDAAAGSQQKAMKNRFCHQVPPVQHQSNQLSQIIHEEDNYFIAVTLCQRCGNKKDHTLYKPGCWPPYHCSNCGNKCVIIDWKVYATDEDDEVIYAGEVVNSAKPKGKKPPTYYGMNGIKLEPQEEFTSIPSCQRCGGYHVPPKGQQYNPGFCPHYNVTYANWNTNNTP